MILVRNGDYCPLQDWPSDIYDTEKIVLFGEVKLKVEFTKDQATKAQRESRGTALLFL
jgi:hypothetical protein